MAGWAARTGWSLGRRLPGARAAERGLRSLERLAFTELRRRLDDVDDPYHVALTQASAGGELGGAGQEPGVAVVPAVEPLRAAMAELLGRSVELGRERAREYLYAVILRQLTPDEARILAALSAGGSFPLLDVVERGGLGGAGRPVVRHASTVGTAAGVSLPDHVPVYVSRLITFGLAEAGAESAELAAQYDILRTDEVVRRAEGMARRAKLARGTLRISPFGLRFWQACDPAGPHPA
ncbi:Abi-alpha family protein [Amycolatopsis arida]|nr:Abi-alpha family protein [Amycolatopsis arida]